MRTVNNHSLLQQCYSSLRSVIQSDSSAIRSLTQENIDWYAYGIDHDNIQNIDIDTDNNVPEIVPLLSDEQARKLGQQINPLDDDDNHRINLYQITLTALYAVTSS